MRRRYEDNRSLPNPYANREGNRDEMLASIAVSLKRIAAALDGTAAGVDISESLCGGRPTRTPEDIR